MKWFHFNFVFRIFSLFQVSAFEIVYHCLITLFRQGKLVVGHAVVHTRRVAERSSSRIRAGRKKVFFQEENFVDNIDNTMTSTKVVDENEDNSLMCRRDDGDDNDVCDDGDVVIKTPPSSLREKEEKISCLVITNGNVV